MGYFDPPEPREISERALMEREKERREEGCYECEADYLPGYLETSDRADHGWTLVCSACSATYDVWQSQADYEDDYEPDFGPEDFD